MSGVHGRPSAIVHELAEGVSNITTGQKPQPRAAADPAITYTSKKNPAIPAVVQVITICSWTVHLLLVYLPK